MGTTQRHPPRHSQSSCSTRHRLDALSLDSRVSDLHCPRRGSSVKNHPRRIFEILVEALRGRPSVIEKQLHTELGHSFTSAVQCSRISATLMTRAKPLRTP